MLFDWKMVDFDANGLINFLPKPLTVLKASTATLIGLSLFYLG